MASYFSLLTFLLGVSMVFAGGYDYGGHGHDYGYNKVAPHAEPYGAKPYQHYGHYHYAKTTCADHYKPGVKNGYFKVYSVQHMGSMKVYCDFTSEPGMAYTMVMSSSVAGRAGAVVVTTPDNLSPFEDVSLAAAETATTKHYVNSNIPNKYAYRQARVDMERISKASKVWRMTCIDTPSDENTFTNYVRVKISEFNPVTAGVTEDLETACKTVEYFSTATKSCAHCKVKILQGASAAGQLLNLKGGCSDNMPIADTDTITVGSCTGVQHSALWFGKPVH